MIHLELERNKAKTLKPDQNTISQAAINISKPSKGATHWLLDTLEVTESRITDNNCDKVIGNEETTGESSGIKCCSCEAWQAWSVESEHCILLIEKKLIERESVLQEKFKSLLKEIENRSETLEEKIHMYELEKIKDKQIIQYLTNKIQQYHKEGQDNIQTQHSFSSIEPSNQLILNNKNDLSTPQKETDECENLRTVKKEKEFVCHLSQETKDKKKVEIEDRNMGEFKKKLRYNMGESTKNLEKDHQVSERNEKEQKDLGYRNNVGESLKIKINGMKNELVKPEASIERDIEENSSMLITNRNGQVTILNKTLNETFDNHENIQYQSKIFENTTENDDQNKHTKEVNNEIESLQQKQLNENHKVSLDKNRLDSIEMPENKIDRKFEEHEHIEQQSELLANELLKQEKSNQKENVAKPSFSNQCQVRQFNALLQIQSDGNTVHEEDFNQPKSFEKESTTKNDRESVHSNGSSLMKRNERELLSEFYSSDEQWKKETDLEKGEKSSGNLNENNNVECGNDVKSVGKESDGNPQNKNYSSNKTINNNQQSKTNLKHNFNYYNSIHSFSNTPFNSKIYTEFEAHRRNESCNEKYGKEQICSQDISQRWKSMPEEVGEEERIIGNVNEYNKRMMMMNKDSKSIYSQETYAFIPKDTKECYAYEDLTAKEIEANSKYSNMIRHEDRQGFKTKMIQEKSEKESVSSLSNDDNSKSNDGMRRHHKIMTFNAGVESICKKGMGVNNGSSLINNTQQEELSCSKRNEGKIKSELSETLGSIGKTTKFGESTNNTFKTIKLTNNVDSDKNNVFHKTAPYSLTRGMKNRNNQFLGIGDKVWQESGEEASVSNWGNPEYGGERPTKKAMEGEDQRAMKFENENLKSYNRVLLDKVAHSRPRMY